MSENLAELVDEAYAKRAQDWDAARRTVRNLLDQACADVLDGSDPSRLDCSQARIKERDRALDKLRRLVESESLALTESMQVEEHLHDIVGLKVLCKSTRDQRAIYEQLCDEDGLGQLGLTKRKDYVSEPKTSGYRACHVILSVPVINSDPVTVEIQIKTRLQDAWGELTHEDLYKPGAAMSPGRFHSSVARAMSALLAEVDLLADDLAQELEASATAAGDEPSTDDTRTVKVRTSGPNYALAVDDKGQQGLIPAWAVRDALGSMAYIDVDDHVTKGQDVVVRVQQSDDGLFYLPVELPEPESDS